MEYSGIKSDCGETLVAWVCPASILPPKNRGRLLTLVNGKETTSLSTVLQPHSMWLKPLTQMYSAYRQLKQTAIKQTVYTDFSGAITDFINGLNILKQVKFFKASCKKLIANS